MLICTTYKRTDTAANKPRALPVTNQ